MKNIKRVAAITMVAGGLAAAGAGVASAHSPQALGTAVGSPGVLSGNLVQAPVHIPVNACGNTATIVGALNPVFGNHCVNF
ncbi:chaplin [Streptomyces gilvosporeus]|uniref:Chaplin n=1 Tax=Streptomyces gilvosporeus TaxID=553510 RepID=A0A1V0TP09_9ACTN|nr:chaplin [Streptomyces gilvosporeus]ARF54676.1 chaplin [Streptomyces gilvosporeus]